MSELVRSARLVRAGPEPADSAADGSAAPDSAVAVTGAVRREHLALGRMRYPVWVRFAGLLLG